MPIMGNFLNSPNLLFLKLNWTAVALKLSKLNGILISIGILRLSSVIRSLKFLHWKIQFLNNWGKQTIKERQNGFWDCSFPPPTTQVFLSRYVGVILVIRPHLQHHISPSVLHCLYLPYNLCFSIPVLSPNFPFFLKLSALSPPLNLSEPVHLKLSLLMIQTNLKFFMFPGLRPNCEPQLKSFLK